MQKGKPTYHRDETQIVESYIFPDVGFTQPSVAAEETVRYGAIYEVLRRLPEEPFRRLEEKIDEFQWFIPHRQVRGMVQPFPVNIPAEEPAQGIFTRAAYAKVLYLSPVLERTAWDVVVATVAHELTHIILDHVVTGVTEAEYEVQEKEVHKALAKWGFEREDKKHQASQKLLWTREQ